MPSKQARAYHWTLRVAARNLLTDNILSLNQCFACDQEISMYQPLRQMMAQTECLKRSHNRLDKYYLLTKEWKNTVEGKVNSDEAKSILSILKNKISHLFDYVETNNEIKLALKNYNQYYQKTKSDLKSDPACESIEKVFLRIENNLQYVAHSVFKNVCTLGFKGDSIVEASNSGYKTGSLAVSTSMKIHTSSSTQLKISENQNMKKYK